MVLDEVKLGAALEEMTLSEGWRHIEEWIKQREKTIVNALKSRNFTRVAEVTKLQGELEAYSKLINEVRHRVEQGQKAREKQE